MKLTLPVGLCALFVLTIACTIVAACGSSGSGGFVPQPNASLGGQGFSGPLNRTVTFQVIVPAAAAARSSHATNRARPAASAPPYISPNIGWVTIDIAEVNGLSLAKPPPPAQPVMVPCPGSATGCSVTVTAPGADGTDLYFVRTFAPGSFTPTPPNLVSTGFVAVTVPQSAATMVGGGTGLQIGGFVASIDQALMPASPNLMVGTPSNPDPHLLVQAIDPAGAIIIGNVQFATPITVITSDSTTFSLNGLAQVIMPGPLPSPIDVHYSGGNTAGTSISATSVNENNQPIAAPPISINVKAKPTPTPTPAPESLYVADAAQDRIYEYGLINGVPAPAATPRRIIQAVFTPSYACLNPSGVVFVSQANLATVAVDQSSNVFVSTACTDADIGGDTPIFEYGPNAVGSPPPTVIDVPQSIGQASYLANSDQISLYPDPNVANRLWIGWPGGPGSTTVVSLQIAAGKATPLVLLGDFCFREFGFAACNGFEPNGPSGPPGGNFETAQGGYAINSTNFGVVGSGYERALTGVLAPQSGAAAVLVLSQSASNSSAIPFSTLGGSSTELGFASGNPPAPPLSLAISGSTLYVLAQANSTVVNGNATAGLANCALDSLALQCSDGFQHLYIAAYDLSQLTAPGAAGTAVDLAPTFLMGADPALSHSLIGCNGIGAFGAATQFLAAANGYLYVANQTGANCSTFNPGSPPFPSEIDVYNVNGLTGVHLDATVAPVARILDPTGTGIWSPYAIAIGPPGQATGGHALLKVRALHAHVRPLGVIHHPMRPR
ncbi:MAG: hypothetical protein JO194_07620 [Candidatus Eremiobacteraeota bacterium]|nr:hypothetical protein [Candidatus Eremiobacteraeota bacterium]